MAKCFFRDYSDQKVADIIASADSAADHGFDSLPADETYIVLTDLEAGRMRKLPGIAKIGEHDAATVNIGDGISFTLPPTFRAAAVHRALNDGSSDDLAALMAIRFIVKARGTEPTDEEREEIAGHIRSYTVQCALAHLSVRLDAFNCANAKKEG